MAKKVRMSDIAETLGVSNVTVSKALSNKDGVSDELRKKIKLLADEMGYQYTNTDNTNHSQIVRIIIAQRYIDSSYSFYWNLYKFIVTYLKQYKCYSVLEIVSFRDEKENILPNFMNDQFLGYIVLGEMEEAYLKTLLKTNKNVVFTDFSNDSLTTSSVITNNYYDTYRLTEYLLKKGHKDIGFVGSISMKNNIYDRYFGYCKAMVKNGCSIQDDWIIEDRNGEDLSFLKTFELPQKMPTAFVCNCDETAYYFIQYLKEKGYSIPEDISIVGYYNFVFSQMCKPELTTVNVDLKAMAKKTVEMILKPSNDYLSVVVNGSIVERESVKTIS